MMTLSQQSEKGSINLAQESEIQKMSSSEILKAYEIDDTLKTLVENGFANDKKCLESDLIADFSFATKQFESH